jgi:hypothetical protein
MLKLHSPQQKKRALRKRNACNVALKNFISSRSQQLQLILLAFSTLRCG